MGTMMGPGPTFSMMAPKPSFVDGFRRWTAIVDERFRPTPGENVRIKILSVPASEKHPEGVTYAIHYGPTDGGPPYLRYDNSHGIHERHEEERTERVDDFPGVGPLLRRFRTEAGL